MTWCHIKPLKAVSREMKQSSYGLPFPHPPLLPVLGTKVLGSLRDWPSIPSSTAQRWKGRGSERSAGLSGGHACRGLTLVPGMDTEPDP